MLENQVNDGTEYYRAASYKKMEVSRFTENILSLYHEWVVKPKGRQMLAPTASSRLKVYIWGQVKLWHG
jgi:hypothetical protein